jgi:ketosteroid isomerase-like protein
VVLNHLIFVLVKRALLRFQTTKRVQGQDPELVLGVLEGCLRSLSNEVVRQGSQITLLGLGPSPRAINRRDTTVIDVKREDGATVIHADVRFQASAFLGTAAQDMVVKEKLDRIFDDLLARLGVSGWTSESEKMDGEAAADAGVRHQVEGVAERVAVGQGIWTKAAEQVAPEPVGEDLPAMNGMQQPAADPGNEAKPATSAVQPEAVAASESIQESVPAEPAPGPAIPAPAEETFRSAAAPANESKEPVAAPEEKNGEKENLPKSAKPFSAAVADLPIQPGRSDESAKDVVEEKTPVPYLKKPEEISRNAPTVVSPQRDSPAVRPPKPATPRPVAVANAPSAPRLSEPAKEMFRAIGIEDEPETGSKWLKWSAWVAAFIVLVVAPLVWLYMPSHPQSAAPVSQPAPAAAAVPAPTPPPPALARQAGDDPDPAMVVSDWEAAMNSTDAAAQAAFYADPVERYFLRHNLSRDEVKADKQAAINRRRGDWSVKMENVKVTRPDDNTAKAKLIKHYTVKEDGKTASEWFVPSLLQMTRANGRWQITSERDLGWATSLEELGY